MNLLQADHMILSADSYSRCVPYGRVMESLLEHTKINQWV